MTRDSKFLSGALIIASLCLTCLELAQADEPPTIPPAPSTVTTPDAGSPELVTPSAEATTQATNTPPQLSRVKVMTIEADPTSPPQFRNLSVEFDLLLDEKNEIEQVFYHSTKNEKIEQNCPPDSRKNCPILLEEARAGLILERYETQTLFILKTEPSFSSAEGGIVELHYLSAVSLFAPNRPIFVALRMQIKWTQDGWQAYLYSEQGAVKPFRTLIVKLRPFGIVNGIKEIRAK